MDVWTHIAVVMVLAWAGCKKDEAAAPTERVAGSGSATGSAAEAPDIAQLTSEFHAAIDNEDEPYSVVLGAKLIDALRAVKPESRELPEALMYYGSALEITGDWKQSRRVLEEASEHPEVAKDRRLRAEIEFRLGSIYNAQLDIDEAIAVLRSAAAAADAFEPDAIQPLLTKEALATALDNQESYQEAEPLFREVLAEYEARDDEDRIATGMANLAVNLELQERDPEALKLYLRMVKEVTSENRYARNSLAEAHSGVGRIYRRQKMPTKAAAAFRKALAVRIETLGADHPTVVRDLFNLALQLVDNKHTKEARGLCEQGLVLGRKKLAPDHLDLVNMVALCERIDAAK